MKKLVSLFLCLSMLLVLAMPVRATEIVEDESYIMEIDGGKLYTIKSADKSVVIMTNDAEHLLDVSITYSVEPEKAYNWIIEDYPETFSYDNSFWNDAIVYCENNLELAETYEVDITIYDEPIEIPQTRSVASSAGNDLTEQLEDLHGPEYFMVPRYTTQWSGETFRVYESQEYRILDNGEVSWKSSMTVGSLISSVLKEVSTSSLIKALCTIFDIVVNAGSIVQPGAINLYICRVQNNRCVTANGSDYMYNITYLFIDYDGYENADHNSGEGAELDVSSKFVEYTGGEDYYYDYYEQTRDAYEMFQQIGQMD